MIGIEVLDQHKAHAGIAGKCLRISEKASNPPADAPMPTMGKGFGVLNRSKSLDLILLKVEVWPEDFLDLISTNSTTNESQVPDAHRDLQRPGYPKVYASGWMAQGFSFLASAILHQRKPV